MQRPVSGVDQVGIKLKDFEKLHKNENTMYYRIWYCKNYVSDTIFIYCVSTI